MAEPAKNWRQERPSGIGAIAASLVVSIPLWFALLWFLPPLAGMDALAARMIVALKCLAVATLFTLVAGVESVAHERFQTSAFDPLAGHQTKRLGVNLRYLQNTLEQIVVFAVGLFGIAAYLSNNESMRAVPATTIVWIFNRLAFWVGYHLSASMRALGAAGMAISLIMLIYVTARIGHDIAGFPGTLILVGLYLGIEAILLLKTR